MTVSAAVAVQNCKVLETLEIGQKLSVAGDGTLSVDEPWLLQGVTRFITGNSRAVTLQAIDACAKWAPASALTPMAVNGVRMLATTYTQIGDAEMARALCDLAREMTTIAQGASDAFSNATAVATATPLDAIPEALAPEQAPASNLSSITEPAPEPAPEPASASIPEPVLEPSPEPPSASIPEPASVPEPVSTSALTLESAAAPESLPPLLAHEDEDEDEDEADAEEDEDEDEDEDENENENDDDADADEAEDENVDADADADADAESDSSPNETRALLPPSRTSSVQSAAAPPQQNPWRRYTSSVVQKTPLCWQTMA